MSGSVPSSTPSRQWQQLCLTDPADVNNSLDLRDEEDPQTSDLGMRIVAAQDQVMADLLIQDYNDSCNCTLL